MLFYATYWKEDKPQTTGYYEQAYHALLFVKASQQDKCTLWCAMPNEMYHANLGEVVISENQSELELVALEHTSRAIVIRDERQSARQEMARCSESSFFRFFCTPERLTEKAGKDIFLSQLSPAGDMSISDGEGKEGYSRLCSVIDLIEYYNVNYDKVMALNSISLFLECATFIEAHLNVSAGAQ
jgi:hypothetical protein